MNKIAVIYCPNRKPFASVEKRRKRIAGALDAYGLDYDMVQPENAASVERHVMMFINNQYDTIIIAGGDSAINSAVNCLMKAEKHVRENVALGVIPNGVMNDFALFWGQTYADVDYAVKSIAERRMRKVDVGCIHYISQKGEENHRYFINCINIGLLAGIQRLRQQTRRCLWSRKLSFVMSAILLVFVKKIFRVTYTIDYTSEEHRISTMCIGNARGYGQTPNAVPYNGLLDITVVRHSALSELIGGIYLFARGKILNHNRIMPYRSRKIEMSLQHGTPVSVDGHPMDTPKGDFSITIEQEQITFIIESAS